MLLISSNYINQMRPFSMLYYQNARRFSIREDCLNFSKENFFMDSNCTFPALSVWAEASRGFLHQKRFLVILSLYFHGCILWVTPKGVCGWRGRIHVWAWITCRKGSSGWLTVKLLNLGNVRCTQSTLFLNSIDSCEIVRGCAFGATCACDGQC